MGYFTYRIFRDVTLERLAGKVLANLALYEPGAIAGDISYPLFAGSGCSGLDLCHYHNGDAMMATLGYQFGGVWMDVRYQDGDWWDLTIFQGTEHVVSHSVNPWAHDEKVDLTDLEFRIGRIREAWPEHADRITRYLLPWREPRSTKTGTVWVSRSGKAYPTDKYEYGDAYQIFDFASAFGIGKPVAVVTVGPTSPPLLKPTKPPRRKSTRRTGSDG